MFQTILPDSISQAPRYFSLDAAKTDFLNHWTRLVKEGFLIELLNCFDEFPGLRSIKFYVDDTIDFADEFKTCPGRYRLTIDYWEWEGVPEPPILMTELEARLRLVFADEIADFMNEPLDRNSVDAALQMLRERQ